MKDCGIRQSGSLSSDSYLSLIDRVGRQHRVLAAAEQPKTLLPVFNSIWISCQLHKTCRVMRNACSMSVTIFK